VVRRRRVDYDDLLWSSAAMQVVEHQVFEPALEHRLSETTQWHRESRRDALSLGGSSVGVAMQGSESCRSTASHSWLRC
jgi:hypothetical protein